MGKKSYIVDVCRQRTAIIEQRGEAERELERTREDTREQRASLAQVIDRVNQQARIIGQLQTQSHAGLIQSVPSTLSNPHSHHDHTQPKMTKAPDLPVFSGELPTPKGEAEVDNWIFQIKKLHRFSHLKCGCLKCKGDS